MKINLQKDPKKVTHGDMKNLFTRIKFLIDVINRGRTYDVHEVFLEVSMVSAKPKIRSKFIEKLTGYNGNIPQYDSINYILGDQDGTWERLLEWIPKLELRAKRVRQAKERMKRIKKRVGEEDILWLIQIGIPFKFIDEHGNIP